MTGQENPDSRISPFDKALMLSTLLNNLLLRMAIIVVASVLA